MSRISVWASNDTTDIDESRHFLHRESVKDIHMVGMRQK